MSNQQRYTISELAQQAGVTPRTIRFYTAEGLLPPPDSRGRYALYSEDHLSRLHLIARLKAAYLPLNLIRDQIQGLRASEIRKLLESLPSEDEAMVAALPQRLLPLRGHIEGDSRFQYGAALSAGGGSATPLQLGRVELREGGSDYIANTPTEAWHRLTLAPGVELHIHSSLTQNARVEELVEAAQSIFARD
jgi:DNA-binding transcriptional MerR regulator